MEAPRSRPTLTFVGSYTLLFIVPIVSYFVLMSIWALQQKERELTRVALSSRKDWGTNAIRAP